MKLNIFAGAGPVVFVAVLAVFQSGCTVFPKLSERSPGGRAFITYLPPEQADGRIRLAVKDNIDVKGLVTTAGSKHFDRVGKPAAKDAPCLEIAREKNVIIVGKTNLSELALAPSGYNEYFGTPKSPLSGWQRLIPGGSSCGAAVAVARGLADVSIGTDTAGSVRVPAACSGVVGLKTTFGLVPIEGIFPVEPKHLDTVGPLGKDIAHTVTGMALLERGFSSKYAAAKSAHPTGRSLRIGRLRLERTDREVDKAVDNALRQAGFEVVELGPAFREKWAQAKRDGNIMAASGAWMSDQQYRRFPGLAGRTKTAILAGRIAYRVEYKEALARRAAWKKDLEKVFRKVDFIALPTMQSGPPAIPINLRIGALEALVLVEQNTVAVNYAGNPALALPIPLERRRVKYTSLQLVGPLRSEAGLLNAGRIVEKAVQPAQPER